MPLGLACAFFVPLLAAQESSLRSLKDVYAASLAASEAVAASEASLREAEALWRSALGASLPLISIRHETFMQDRAFGFNQNRQQEGGFRAAWAGLTGYRELYLLRGASATEAQRTELRRRAEQLLLGDAAAAYYGLLQAREDETVAGELIVLAEKRLDELQDRVRVGRTREADASSQEFQAASLKSQQEESRRLSQARADLLGFLARAPVDPAPEPFEAPPSPAGLDAYLPRVESRPDVRAAARSAEAAANAVHVARADRFPALGLGANRYLYRPPNRIGNDWDLSLTASLPLFSWGGISGNVAAAKAARTREELTLRAARRSAELEIRNAWRDRASAQRQLDIQIKAVAIARRDYDLQRRDERRGLVTSLEVLESLNRLNSARLGRNRAALQVRLAAIALELAAGATPEEILR